VKNEVLEKMPRGRYRRDDYDREGPIHIYISYRHAFGGFLLLVLGTTIRGLTTHYSNSSKIREDHQCPALDGRIHLWVANLGNLFIVLSVVLFSVGGIVPKLFHVCQLRDNAICCGKIFMTTFGSVIEFVGFVVFVLFNFYGTTLLREGYEKGIQTTEKYPPKLFEVYCDKIIWNMFRVTNYGTYALIGIYILYLLIIAILKLNRFTKDLKKPTLSFSLREREILDTLGYVYEDETDEQSDEEKKDETKNLLEPHKEETKSKVKKDPLKKMESNRRDKKRPSVKAKKRNV